MDILFPNAMNMEEMDHNGYVNHHHDSISKWKFLLDVNPGVAI